MEKHLHGDSNGTHKALIFPLFRYVCAVGCFHIRATIRIIAKSFWHPLFMLMFARIDASTDAAPVAAAPAAVATIAGVVAGATVRCCCCR